MQFVARILVHAACAVYPSMQILKRSRFNMTMVFLVLIRAMAVLKNTRRQCLKKLSTLNGAHSALILYSLIMIRPAA